MFFSLDVMRARKGDCLMLHHGAPSDPHLIMIDGGPATVYGEHLKPRIQQVRTARKVQSQKPLPVDVLMVSHVDDDHIQGILDLTRELITAQQQHKPQLLRVDSFWHNSFENIIGQTPQELTAAFKTNFAASLAGGTTPDDLTIESNDPKFGEEAINSALKVLASIPQGAQLRNDANKLQFPLNPEFNAGLIMARQTNEAIEVVNGLRFSVVGPMQHELKALHSKHQSWLKELEKKGLTPNDVLSAHTVLAAFLDDSVPNLSSIVVLAEAEDASMLLTGDARGDKILKGLEFTGRVTKGGKMHVDVLKVPHHGSANNLALEFFRRISADHYVFSGNGEHGNPERESLQMLLDARPDSDEFAIHLTYPIEEIDKARKADWEKEQAKEKKRKEKDPQVEVRANWSAKTNSLTEFFKAHKNFAKKVQIVEPGKAHLINLRDAPGV